jgi:hypothetical protein
MKDYPWTQADRTPELDWLANEDGARMEEERIARLVDEVENDPTIPEEDKARLYPGVYELHLAELRSRDAIDFEYVQPDDPLRSFDKQWTPDDLEAAAASGCFDNDYLDCDWED